MADLSGISWSTNDSGKVSTTEVAKRIWCSCLDAILELTEDRAAVESLKAMITAEKNWRHSYQKYLPKLAALIFSTPQTTMAAASAGLNSSQEEFVFFRGEYSGNTLKTVIGDAPGFNLQQVETEIVEGRGEDLAELGFPVEIVESRRVEHRFFSGQSFVEQAKAWASYGSCEPSVAASIENIIALPPQDLTKGIKDRIFCFIGATSELCPAKSLLKMGATVAAIARPGSKLNALMRFAETTPGKLLVPRVVEESSETAPPGLDMLHQAPEASAWFLSLAKEYTDKKICLGFYVYMDGERHVRATIAGNAIIHTLQEALSPENFEVAQLLSPSTLHLWPDESYAAAVAKWEARSWWARVAMFKSNSGTNALRTAQGDRAIHNGLIVLQGPNYVLAKTLQMFQCIKSRSANVRVSANFSPACRTQSMTSNATMSKLLNGMQAFEPVLVLQSGTASHFMTALLLADLLLSTTAANPKNNLDHPYDLFTDNSFHGGNWCTAFDIESTGTVTYVLGSLKVATGTAALIS